MFTQAYGKFIYTLYTFAIRRTYRQSDIHEFSIKQHGRALKLNKIAERVFNLLVSLVAEKKRLEYTVAVNYEDCKLLIRPFIYRELIMGSGLWEPYVKEVINRDLKKNDVMVDIGANIGVYALPIAKKAMKVIAFEPHPTTYDLLERSVRLNSLNNIQLINKAVGDSSKKVTYGLFSIPQESRIVTSTEQQMDSMIEMECVELDAALRDEDKIDWLLIDAEGNELDILMGARGVLRKYYPKVIFELHNQDTRERLNEILAAEGYSVRPIYGVYYYYATKKE